MDKIRQRYKDFEKEARDVVRQCYGGPYDVENGFAFVEDVVLVRGFLERAYELGKAEVCSQREAYLRGRKAGMEEAAKICEDEANTHSGGNAAEYKCCHFGDAAEIRAAKESK